MTREFEVDRLLEDWLADGPSQLPDRTVDAIVRQLDTTPQQRHGWLPRRDPLNRIVLAFGSAAAVVLLFVLVLGMFVNQPGVGGPPVATPSPSPTTPEPTASPAPSPEPEGELFVSERYGYSLRLPDDQWRVVERPGEWAPGTTYDQAGQAVDTILHRVVPVYLHDVFINSQPLAEGTSFEEWLTAYDQLQRTHFPHCRSDDQYETSVVDGIEARIDTAVCEGDRWAQAIWTHGGRVYVLRVGEHRSSEVKIDPRQEIEEWLGRITLHRP